MHLQLGQLSQLLGSVEDELSALEKTDREKGREGTRGGEGVVIATTIVGSSKRLSVTQRTATFLTLSFINSHSKPLYRCHGTFSLKCCYRTHLQFFSFRNITLATHTHRQRGGNGSGHSKGREKETYSCTHGRTHTQLLEVVWRVDILVGACVLLTPCFRFNQISHGCPCDAVKTDGGDCYIRNVPQTASQTITCLQLCLVLPSGYIPFCQHAYC